MSETGGLGAGRDDAATLCAISVVAAALANVLHEGVGHAAVALATGTQSGVLSTVAWSSGVGLKAGRSGWDAGEFGGWVGVLVGVEEGGEYFGCFRREEAGQCRDASVFVAEYGLQFIYRDGLFLFFRSDEFWGLGGGDCGAGSALGVEDGSGAGGSGVVLRAILALGAGLVRYVGVGLGGADGGRMRRMTLIPYLTAIVLLTVGGLPNPLGMKLVWESALPSTAGADCGLIWMKYYIPKRTAPDVERELVRRSWGWVGVAAVVAGVFVLVLGRGIGLHR
jgi:hypothetical protein